MINDSIDNLRLDINKPRVRASISVRKGDTKTRTLHICLTSNGSVYPLDNVLMAELLINKPDGKICDQDMVIDGNELQYTFRTQDTNVEGECICQIRLTFKDGACLTAPEFTMYVYNMIQNQNTITSQNEYGALVAALTEANDLRQYVQESVIEVSQKATECAENVATVVEAAIVAETAAATASSAMERVTSDAETVETYKNAVMSAKEEVSAAKTAIDNTSSDILLAKEEVLNTKEVVKTSATQVETSKAAAVLAEENAKASENAALTAKQIAEECVVRTHASELAAKAAADAAAFSEDNASISEANAKESENNAYVSEANANASKLAAKLAEAQALIYEQECNEHDINCKASADAAALSEGNAKVSEDNAKDSEGWCKYYYEHMSQEGSLVLGETELTAFRGDHGKVAYEHSQLTSGNPHNVTYVDVGADMSGSAAKALNDANDYTDAKIADLINGAPSTLDTLKEIADAFTADHAVVEALDQAIGSKATKTELQTHEDDTVKHITSAERTTWNNKAEKTVATTSAAGLMGALDKSKLDGVEANANNYAHPTHGAKTSGLYKITVDELGHVSAATAVTKADITNLGIPGQDTNTNTTYSLTQDASDGHKITLTPSSGTAQTITIPDNNTKNTAGSTDTSSKIFLIGATSQGANPQTYSHDTAYVGTDGCLYSGGKKVFAPTEATGTLAAGATSVAISNAAITTSSTIEVFTNTFGVAPTAVAVVAGKVTLTFDKQSAAVSVKVRIS